MRKLVKVPYHQQRFIQTECLDDFEWDEYAHNIWGMIMRVACGIDERFLPNYKDYDFDTELHLFRTCGDDEKNRFNLMQDSLNCLLYECTENEYYELCANIAQVMMVMDEIEKLDKREEYDDLSWMCEK